MSNSTQQEVAQLIGELREISKKAKSDTSRILKVSAKPLVSAISIAAPKSTGRKIHKRYSTVKLSKKIRAGRGKGTVVATYAPGNLAASFAVLPFSSKLKYKVVIGAKLAKGSAKGDFGPNGRTDGYYAHMVERGTRHSQQHPFVGPTWARMKEPTKTLIITKIKRKIKRIKKASK